MVAKNDITGDEIKSRGSSKKFKDNLDKIKPSCYNDCKYLVNTLTKCRVCSWKNKDDWDESRIDTIGQNGNDGDHYE
jgi:hypothetical protein